MNNMLFYNDLIIVKKFDFITIMRQQVLPQCVVLQTIGSILCKHLLKLCLHCFLIGRRNREV